MNIIAKDKQCDFTVLRAREAGARATSKVHQSFLISHRTHSARRAAVRRLLGFVWHHGTFESRIRASRPAAL
jgi:hypothetical protein